MCDASGPQVQCRSRAGSRPTRDEQLMGKARGIVNDPLASTSCSSQLTRALNKRPLNPARADPIGSGLWLGRSLPQERARTMGGPDRLSFGTSPIPATDLSCALSGWNQTNTVVMAAGHACEPLGLGQADNADEHLAAADPASLCRRVRRSMSPTLRMCALCWVGAGGASHRRRRPRSTHGRASSIRTRPSPR